MQTLSPYPYFYSRCAPINVWDAQRDGEGGGGGDSERRGGGRGGFRNLDNKNKIEIDYLFNLKLEKMS